MVTGGGGSRLSERCGNNLLAADPGPLEPVVNPPEEEEDAALEAAALEDDAGSLENASLDEEAWLV